MSAVRRGDLTSCCCNCQLETGSKAIAFYWLATAIFSPPFGFIFRANVFLAILAGVNFIAAAIGLWAIGQHRPQQLQGFIVWRLVFQLIAFILLILFWTHIESACDNSWDSVKDRLQQNNPNTDKPFTKEDWIQTCSQGFRVIYVFNFIGVFLDLYFLAVLRSFLHLIQTGNAEAAREHPNVPPSGPGGVAAGIWGPQQEPEFPAPGASGMSRSGGYVPVGHPPSGNQGTYAEMPPSTTPGGETDGRPPPTYASQA
jgi:hypothetical protein